MDGKPEFLGGDSVKPMNTMALVVAGYSCQGYPLSVSPERKFVILHTFFRICRAGYLGAEVCIEGQVYRIEFDGVTEIQFEPLRKGCCRIGGP